MTIYILARKGKSRYIFNRRKSEFEELLLPLSYLRKSGMKACRLGFKPQMAPIEKQAKAQELTHVKIFEV